VDDSARFGPLEAFGGHWLGANDREKQAVRGPPTKVSGTEVMNYDDMVGSLKKY
jgi:hypothetical protein